MSLRVLDLTKTYGRQKALDSITFETKSNCIIGFLGPNGAGKSTTMKILAGILPFDRGQCFVNDTDIQLNPLQVKKMIGYLPENNPMYTELYIQEVLEFEAGLHQIKKPKKRIEEVIALTGLKAEQHKKVNQLSRGYKQRVGLAMAIIHDPQVLILDEPTSGLDPNQIVEIRMLIKNLSKNKTVFISTHLMQEVEAICDDIIIISNGYLQDHFVLADAHHKYPNMNMEEIFAQLTTAKNNTD